MPICLSEQSRIRHQFVNFLHFQFLVTWPQLNLKAQENLKIYLWRKHHFVLGLLARDNCQSFIWSEQTFDPSLKPLHPQCVESNYFYWQCMGIVGILRKKLKVFGCYWESIEWRVKRHLFNNLLQDFTKYKILLKDWNCAVENSTSSHNSNLQLLTRSISILFWYHW